jgi:hypothetical protein
MRSGFVLVTMDPVRQGRDGYPAPVRVLAECSRGDAINPFTTMARSIAAVALKTFGASAFAQQAYPSRPIRLIAPFAAGKHLEGPHCVC